MALPKCANGCGRSVLNDHEICDVCKSKLSVECMACEGSGIIGRRGDTKTCPQCNGKGYVRLKSKIIDVSHLKR